MKNFLIRAVTGIVFVIVLIIAIIGHSWFYGFLFTLITVLSLNEFYKLVVNLKEKPSINTLPALISGGYLFFASFLYFSANHSIILFLPYLLYILFIFIFEIYNKKENPVLNIAYTLMGHFYVVLPFSLYNFLFIPANLSATITFTGISDAALLPLCVFIFIWLNDTGAYLAGVTLGKHKLFPRISPAKSWEGFFGGVALSIIAAVIISYYFPVLSIIQWIGFALIIVVAGTFGDLWESLMKRTAGIKDSGKMLPGHGGFLDRFDSALLAIPASVLYLYMIL